LLLISQDLPPTQLGATTSYSETGKVPSRPLHLHLHLHLDLHPTNKTKTKPKTAVIEKAKQTTRRYKKAVTNAPVEDSWTGAWATAIGPEQASNPLQPTLNNQGRGSREEFWTRPVADQPTNKKPRPRFKTGILQAP
ncbi:MAG: hypothetical protein ACKPKO_56340, partial [Candidatus Fonsibacter sp.]